MFTVNNGGTKIEHAANLSKAYNPIEKLSMTVFQWNKGQPQGQMSTVEGVEKLKLCPPSDLTIITTELDIFESPRAHNLLALFKYFDVPDAFVGERLNSVSYSFGNYEWESGVEYSWLHSLCKNVEVEENNTGQTRRLKIKTTHKHPQARALRGSDYSWHRSSYLCKTEPNDLPVTGGRHVGQSSSTVVGKRVTFLCFGPPESLEQRFRQLCQRWAWENALQEPYIIFHVVLGELYQQLDTMVSRLSDVFGDIEHIGGFNQANLPGAVAEEVDFLELHNVAKFVIYLNEGADAILLAMDSMLASCLSVNAQVSAPLTLLAPRGLQYCKGQFQSTKLQLRSLEKRMSNTINLAFNLITQHDNRIIQRDSTSMKTIAVLTLVFLPTTAIATIFGTQFFDFGEDGDNSRQLHVSRWIWLFALVSVLVTVAVCVAWMYRDWRVKRRLLGEGLFLNLRRVNILSR